MHVSPQAFPFLHILQQAILAGSAFKPGISITLKDGSRSFKLIDKFELLCWENPKIRETAVTVNIK